MRSNYDNLLGCVQARDKRIRVVLGLLSDLGPRPGVYHFSDKPTKAPCLIPW